MRISGSVEFLAEDVGIDFLINEVAGIELQNRPQRFKESVSPIYDGRSAVQNEAPSRHELCHTLFGNAQPQGDAKFAAAVSIESSILVN